LLLSSGATPASTPLLSSNVFLEAASLLRELPHSGRIVPEIGDDSIRELLVYSWRLIYNVGDHVVTITTILHQRQHFHPQSPHLR
jgi:toxin ParE1/3/4